MKAKVIKTGEIITPAYTEDPELFLYKGVYYLKSDLDFNISAPEKVVIEGYVTRDLDGTLLLHCIKPERACDDDGNYNNWGNSVDCKMYLPTRLFPSITWQSEPLKVRIEITLIDEKGV